MKQCIMQVQKLHNVTGLDNIRQFPTWCCHRHPNTLLRDAEVSFEKTLLQLVSPTSFRLCLTIVVAHLIKRLMYLSCSNTADSRCTEQAINLNKSILQNCERAWLSGGTKSFKVMAAKGITEMPRPFSHRPKMLSHNLAQRYRKIFPCLLKLLSLYFSTEVRSDP